MKLTMNTRREIIKKMAPEYQKATKKEKRKGSVKTFVSLPLDLNQCLL